MVTGSPNFDLQSGWNEARIGGDSQAIIVVAKMAWQSLLTSMA
jgi:hypothetical protein